MARTASKVEHVATSTHGEPARKPAPPRRVPPAPESYCRRALERGALDAVLIGPEGVAVAEWVRIKCQFGCGGYGRRRTCPPYSPTHEQTRRMLDEYVQLMLVHCDNGELVREIVTDLEREAFLDGHYKAFAFGCGPCFRCDDCAMEKGCNHPGWSRPAMEACGIDVFATARAAGLPIETVRDRDDEQNHYGLLLIG